MLTPARIRSLALWLAAWVALSAAAFALAYGVKAHPSTSDPVRLLNNALLLLTFPGWAAMRVSSIVLGTPHSTVLAYTLGAGFIVAGVFIAGRLRRAAIAHTTAEPDEGRRRFLVNAASAAVVLPTSGLASAAVASEPYNLRVVRHRLTLDGFGADLGEITVVNVTDTHLGTRVPESHIRRAYDLAIAQKPDIAVMTGDFIYNDHNAIEPAARLAVPFIRAARLGAFAVLGNHDHYIDAPAMRRALEAQGARVIDNDHRLLAIGGRALRIAGLGDYQMDDTRADRALLGESASTPTILLAHQPDTAEHPDVLAAARAGARIDAMLCGHTHGGQVRVPLLGTPMIPSKYGQKYAQGLVDGPAFPVFVSAGVGMSILPVRWNVPPEITVLTIECRA